MNDDHRPDPDKLLNRLSVDAKKAQRGRLKIFFGSSAGVGKTYAMLTAAHEQLNKGVDVLAAVVETHKRSETERLLAGLPRLPPLVVHYRGMTLRELDLSAALERKPDILLVDELAHTNAPGLRHPKRWNDVNELLEAGIDVYTTLNVQHIESLSDLVAGTTGVWVKETVPDSIFESADDIVLVDIDVDDLLARLHEGKVYVAPGAQARAAENFFKKENLNALRELALRRTAQQVDAERAAEGQTEGKQPVADKILVCIAPNQLSAKLIRSAKRMATALKAPWTAVYVDNAHLATTGEDHRRLLSTLEHMVERIGGQIVTLHGDNIIEEIITYAKLNNFTKIVVGKDYKRSWRNLLNGYFVDRIIRQSGYIDVYVITDDYEARPDPAPAAPHSALSFARLQIIDYVLAFLTVAGFTVPGIVMPGILTATDQALLYLTGIVMVAERLGLGPSLFYALLAASAFNIFFLMPNGMHPLQYRSYLMTFVVMLVTGYTMASQASRLRYQANSARKREEKTNALYSLTKQLTSTRGRFPVSQIIAKYIADYLNVEVAIWMTNADGHPAIVLGNIPENTYYKDMGALQWCYENGHNAGAGTSTLPSATGFYLPLMTGHDTLGVIGLFPKGEERSYTHEEVATLETLASLLASALERVRAGEIAQQAMIETENEKLRASLLKTVSMDFRMPLENFAGSVTSLMAHSPSQDLDSLRRMAVSLNQEAGRLTKKVGHLLDASSLETGSVQLNRLPNSLAERIDLALAKLDEGENLACLETNIPPDLPDVLGDPNLIEQVLINILENALKFSPPKGIIHVAVERQGAELVTTITDQGPGIFKGQEKKIFEKFYSAPAAEQERSTGLGLTIAAGIISLHGGRIWAENAPTGGARFSFTLPIA